MALMGFMSTFGVKSVLLKQKNYSYGDLGVVRKVFTVSVGPELSSTA